MRQSTPTAPAADGANPLTALADVAANLFISGALTLLFLLSLAMMHLLARQGSLIILRSVIKIRPEPIADAA